MVNKPSGVHVVSTVDNVLEYVGVFAAQVGLGWVARGVQKKWRHNFVILSYSDQLSCPCVCVGTILSQPGQCVRLGLVLCVLSMII